jgi:hypothetical protein
MRMTNIRGIKNIVKMTHNSRGFDYRVGTMLPGPISDEVIAPIQ